MSTTEAAPVTETPAGTLPAAAVDQSVWTPAADGTMALPVSVYDHALPLGQAGNPAYDSAVEHLRVSGLPEADVAALQSGRPLTVTRQTYETDLAMRNRLMKDPEFVKRYLAGGQKELSAMLQLGLRISAARVID